MDRNQQNLAILRTLATQSYRGKSQHAKALMLLQELNVTKAQTAQALSMTPRSINRAFRAEKEGRDLGRNGKPPIFNRDDIEQILRRLFELRENTTLTIDIIREQVRLVKYQDLRSHIQFTDAQILDK